MITSDVGPWGVVPRAMILDMEGDTTAGLAYALLSSYADRQTDDGWKISRKQLADELGVSLSTMKRALKKLEDKGWICSVGTVTPEGDQGWNRYVVLTSRGGVMGEPTEGHERTDRGSPESLTLRPLEQTPQTDGAARKRPRNELWDALEAEMGPAETRTAQSLRGMAVRDLKEVGATPEEIQKRCKVYRRKYKGLDLTETALLKHWSRLNGGRQSEDYYDPDTGAWMAAETRPNWR